MSSLPALAAEVCARPEDAEPRLAYADAARARDPDRARFIALELAHREARRRGEEPDDAQARQLVRVHGARWAGEAVVRAARAHAFYGGFVELLELDAAAFVAAAASLVAQAPLRHLRVRKLAPALAAFVARPELAQIVSLDVAGCQLRDEDVAALVASPHLRRLRLLTVANNPVAMSALRAIGRADLPELRFVDAAMTDAALVVQCSDDEGDLAWTRARAELRAELGARPWLDARVKPHVDAL